MIRLHLDVGYNKVMVLEYKKGLIHYLDEIAGSVVVMGPLQPGEVPYEGQDLLEVLNEESGA